MSKPLDGRVEKPSLPTFDRRKLFKLGLAGGAGLAVDGVLDVSEVQSPLT